MILNACFGDYNKLGMEGFNVVHLLPAIPKDTMVGRYCMVNVSL